MSRPILLRLLAFLAAALLGGAIATPAAAQAGLVGKSIAICAARAESGMTPRSVLAGHGAFACDEHRMPRGWGNFWVLSQPLRRSGPQAVRFGSVWQQRATIYALYADGAVLRSVLDQQGISRHLQMGAIIEQSFPARPAPLVRLAWYVEGAANLRGIVREPRLATPQESMRSNLLMAALYAAFGGLCIALLCYNMALWAALRHHFQLAYCAMVLALLAYALSSSGALAWIWPGIGNDDRLRINYLTLGLSSVAAFSFARCFFEPRVFAGLVGKIVIAACGVMATASFAFAIFARDDIWALDRFYSWAFVAQMAVIAPILWRAWVTRSNYLWLFALAWGAPVVMACLRIASSLNGIRGGFWLDNSTIMTMSLEALLSSLAIAYRMRLLSVERDEARESEIAAQMLANTDPLTGLLNRRAFLNKAIGREGEHVLMIADLDHFKRVNETIGHDGGDEVLRIFARTLRQSVPLSALVARIGGEEFAIITSIDDPIEARDILERLRAWRMPFDIPVTASIGTCTGPLLREADWKALYACADRALFEAKTAGRDRVRERLLAA